MLHFKHQPKKELKMQLKILEPFSILEKNSLDFIMTGNVSNDMPNTLYCISIVIKEFFFCQKNNVINLFILVVMAESTLSFWHDSRHASLKYTATYGFRFLIQSLSRLSNLRVLKYRKEHIKIHQIIGTYMAFLLGLLGQSKRLAHAAWRQIKQVECQYSLSS